MEILFQIRQNIYKMKNLQKLSDEILTKDVFEETKESFIKTFRKTQRNLWNVLNKPPDEVKPKYLQFFAKAFNCKVDDILNQPTTTTPKTLDK